MFIIVDLEATCWEPRRSDLYQETIEIGAVKFDSNSNSIVDEFSTFIKPVYNPILTDFCTRLTTITQKDVDGAPIFVEAFHKFMEWADIGNSTFGSWGNFDRNLLRKQCFDDMVCDDVLKYWFYNHTNIKQTWAEHHGIKPRGVGRALRHMGMEFEGTPHRGIDDARNIARLFQTTI